MRPRSYLDHAATTEIRPVALEAFAELSARRGNASALHSSGRGAKLALEDARDRLAGTLGAHPSEVILTAGGTEADNLALKGLWWARRADPVHGSIRRRILLTGIEHHAVLDTVAWLEEHEGAELEFIPVAATGRVDEDAWSAALADAPETIALATLMWANNEIGTVQPVHRLAAACREAGVPLHVDAVQAFGALEIDFTTLGATTLAISGHKIGAPIGIGALLIRRDAVVTPLLHGGGQEREIRSGTLPGPLLAAFAAAAEEATADLPAERARLAGLRDRLIAGIRQAIPEAQLQGEIDRDPDTGEPLEPGTRRLPGNVHFSFPGCEGDSLLFGLDMAGVESSTGSACTAGVSRPSHVLIAAGADEATARSTQRFSLGHTSSDADVDHVLDVLPAVYEQARRAGMAGEDSSIRTANSHRSR
ncbi:MAG: cysteine desulfurase family protein [Micrococcaceae bacterium]